MDERQGAGAPRTPYEAIGGADAFRRIVDRFYDLMETDPAYRELREMHAADLTPMRSALASFLAGWAGGPRDWFDANPGRCMFSVHGDFPITAATAEQWADAMRRAIGDCDLLDPALAEQLADRLTMMARGLSRTAA